MPIPKVNDCLDWYSKNIGGEYIPVIQSAKSLREKFVKLEDAMCRVNKKDVKKETQYERNIRITNEMIAKAREEQGYVE